jgi:hypothetical protein
VGDKILYEKTTKATFKPNSTVNKEEMTKTRENGFSDNKGNKNTPTFIICQQCGTQNDSHQYKCTNCGYKLQD